MVPMFIVIAYFLYKLAGTQHNDHNGHDVHNRRIIKPWHTSF